MLKRGGSIYAIVRLTAESPVFDQIQMTLDGLYQLDRRKLYSHFTPAGLAGSLLDSLFYFFDLILLLFSEQ